MTPSETKKTGVERDAVNAFFRQFYPSDYASAWETRHCAGSYGRAYNGVVPDRRIFPEIVCADGFRMSVQGHFGAYSHPREDFADEYSAVEVMTAPDAEPLFAEHHGSTCDEYSLYGYVPVGVVLAIIEKHGGIDADLSKAVSP